MAKMRVHELAKELGIENKQIIEFLSTTEHAVKQHRRRKRHRRLLRTRRADRSVQRRSPALPRYLIRSTASREADAARRETVTAVR